MIKAYSWVFIAALKRQSSDFNKTMCPFQHPDVGYKHARKALHLKTVHMTSEGSPLFAVFFSYEFPAERKVNFTEYFSSRLLVFIMAGCLDSPPKYKKSKTWIPSTPGSVGNGKGIPFQILFISILPLSGSCARVYTVLT